MKKKIAIIGSNGNMGRRYKSILDYLGHSALEFDVHNIQGDDADLLVKKSNCDGVIIAAPTTLHDHYTMSFGVRGLPILCEKPFIKNFRRCFDSIKVLSVMGINLQMVDQYAFMGVPEDAEGLTMYDYFKSGGDTLPWDCINVIAKAKGEISLSNKSPIWLCSINGYTLDLKYMDMAYIKMVRSWIKDPKPNFDYIANSHKAVEEFIKHGSFTSTNCDSGTLDK